MKKILILFLILSLLVVNVSVQANENLDLQLEVRYVNLDRIARTLEVSMDTLASYISEIKGDTAKLEQYKSEFNAKTKDFRNAKTNSELDAKMQAASSDVGLFWKEYTTQFDANKGNAFVSLKRLGDSLKGAKPELDSLTENYWEVRKDNVLQIYDNDVDGAQKIVNMLQNHKCASQINSKLNEIKNARSELESALSSKNDIQIYNIQNKIILMAQELGNFIAGKC